MKITITAILFSILIIASCSPRWTTTIKKGSIVEETFQITVPLEKIRGLYFLPVRVGGKTYRFLFDTGAPFSISERLQNTFRFKTVSKGNIVDSDHNRKTVKWVQVDSFQLGAVTFVEQTAFVGDFRANPILACLEIDGIIGSNVLRQANWEINPISQTITCYSFSTELDSQPDYAIPFRSDFQYNMFIDLQMGGASISNILVDFGSNSTFNLTKEIFAILEGQGILEKTGEEHGLQASGIVGSPIGFNRSISLADTIQIVDLIFENVSIKTGKTTSIGTGLLSNCIVGIDWQAQRLYSTKCQTKLSEEEGFGLSLGISDEKVVSIQSVKNPSPAFAAGLRPGMQVLRFGEIDFEKGGNFCDYVFHETQEKITLKIKTSGKSEVLELVKR